MENFLQMLELQAVLLIYLLLGVLCNKTGMITKDNLQRFIDLIINIFMPCMVFNSFKSITIEMLSSALNVLVISIAICALSWALGKVLYRSFPEKQERVARYGTLISNAGFAGLPIAQQTFGDVGLAYASIYLIPIRFFMWSAGMTMLSGEHSSPAAIAKKLATNPCVIVILPGLLRGLLGIELPSPVETALSGLSSCVSPLSMMAVGAIIANVDVRSLFAPRVLYYCAVRLALIPLISFGMCTLIGAGTEVAGTCLLLAAMPAPATASLLAARYGADAEFGAKLVGLSTVLSLITVPVLMLLL